MIIRIDVVLLRHVRIPICYGIENLWYHQISKEHNYQALFGQIQPAGVESQALGIR